MEPSAATPTPPENDVPDEPQSGVDVLVRGPAHLGEGELEAIGRALIDLTLPLSTAWSELLGREVEVAVGDVVPGPDPRPPDAEPDPSATILDSVGDAGCFVAIGSFGGELATNAIVVPTPLGLVVVDVLLGGSGRPTGERSLSAIDLDLLTTVVAPTFATVRLIGAPERVDLPVAVRHDLEEPELTELLASGATANLMITIGDHTQPLLLVLSAQAARHLSGTTGPAPVDASAEGNLALLRSVLADVVIEAVVSFPSIQVPSHTILGLDVGDVIGLGTDPERPLPLRVDGHHLADVRPARVGGDVVCQVVSTVVQSTAPAPSRSGSSAPGGLL